MRGTRKVFDLGENASTIRDACVSCAEDAGPFWWER